MKALSVRLDDALGSKFDDLCRRTGYKKNTVISRLVEAYVRSESAGGRRRPGTRKGRDPFEEAIGMLDLKPLAVSQREIDRVVYEL